MPDKKKTYNFEASELTFFHRVSFETWVGVEELIKSLIRKRAEGHKRITLKIDEDTFWLLARFCEQMDFGYRHPRSDSHCIHLDSIYRGGKTSANPNND